MIKLPSERKILRILTICTATLLYGGMLFCLVFIALFFDWLPVPSRILFLALASICLLALKYIYSNLKELLKV